MEQIKTLGLLLAADREDSTVLVDVAFRLAGLGAWAEAVKLLDSYAQRPHRPCAVAMSACLLRAEMMAVLGQRDKARAELEAISTRNNWPWYPAIACDLVSPALNAVPPIGQDSVKLLTLEAARGLWAEAHVDPKAADSHYREALDSYLSSWSEYRFALNRIKQLRKAENGTAAEEAPRKKK